MNEGALRRRVGGRGGKLPPCCTLVYDIPCDLTTIFGRKELIFEKIVGKIKTSPRLRVCLLNQQEATLTAWSSHGKIPRSERASPHNVLGRFFQCKLFPV